MGDPQFLWPSCFNVSPLSILKKIYILPYIQCKSVLFQFKTSAPCPVWLWWKVPVIIRDRLSLITCALVYFSFQKAFPEVKKLSFWCNTVFIFCPIQEITLLCAFSYVNGSQGCNFPAHLGCQEDVDYFVVFVTVLILHRTDPFRKWISSHPHLSYPQAPEHCWHFLSGVFLCPCMLWCKLLLLAVTGNVYMLTSIWQVSDQQLELTDILQHTSLLVSLSISTDYGSHLE